MAEETRKNILKKKVVSAQEYLGGAESLVGREKGGGEEGREKGKWEM